VKPMRIIPSIALCAIAVAGLALAAGCSDSKRASNDEARTPAPADPPKLLALAFHHDT